MCFSQTTQVTDKLIFSASHISQYQPIITTGLVPNQILQNCVSVCLFALKEAANVSMSGRLPYYLQ